MSAARYVHKVFVGNLPWTIGNKELKQYFSKFGHVSDTNVIYDRLSGLSRGYGFVMFSNRDGYNGAVSEGIIHHVEGRLLAVKPITAKE